MKRKETTSKAELQAAGFDPRRPDVAIETFPSPLANTWFTLAGKPTKAGGKANSAAKAALKGVRCSPLN